jgi:sialic acid synthase SpsE/mannose-6-phosphate isomerase-like protein (cupin superfamily)
MPMSERLMFVFEMANNHMGDVEHGIRIIREMKAASADFPFRFCVKLQYRDLESCIHPDYKNRFDLKYVKRFSETRLSWDDYRKLKDAIVDAGFVSMCTPFDEVSVEKIVEHGYDIMKIASCYLTDWPLLEKIAKCDLPIVASTAGEPLEEIDRVVSFLRHRNKDLTIMHCVGEYPAPDEHLHLGQISLLKARYPDIPVGYSTHERPGNFEAVKIALALGSVMFEKHVGVATEKYPLNSYSANPEQVRKWLQSASDAASMIGDPSQRYPAPPGEQVALSDLARGAFVREPVGAGEVLHHSNVFFAMPNQKEQLVAQDFSKYSEFIAQRNMPAFAPVLRDAVEIRDSRAIVHKIVSDVKVLLRKSRVVVPGQVELEISHHYGIDKFYKFGIVMITVVNREYCKKLIVVLPNQNHPEQLHKVKEETYHILYGDVSVVLDGTAQHCKAGDVIVIPRGTRHAFTSKAGCIIEEISSSHIVNDSFYTDPAISANGNRKTFVTYWMD